MQHAQKEIGSFVAIGGYGNYSQQELKFSMFDVSVSQSSPTARRVGHTRTHAFCTLAHKVVCADGLAHSKTLMIRCCSQSVSAKAKVAYAAAAKQP
eukprot:4845102-Pleurochrysis_carterae.AAC.1